MYGRKPNAHRQDFIFSSYTAKPSMIPMWGRRLTPRKAIYALVSLIAMTLMVYLFAYSYSGTSLLTINGDKSRSRLRGERPFRKPREAEDETLGIPRDKPFRDDGGNRRGNAHDVDSENAHDVDSKNALRTKDNEGPASSFEGGWEETPLDPGPRIVQEFFDYAGDFSARAEEKDIVDDGHNRYQRVKAVIKRLRNREPFSPVFNRKEKLVFMDLLEMFDEMCKRHQITYFIYGGTLLGSFRHHDLISWDDDVDVIIPVKQKPLLIDAMQNIENKYKLVTTSREHFKIYSKQKSEIMNLYFDWAWPYLDVSFYGENSTHIWDIAETYGRSYEYQKGYIFPLHLRPLGKLWLPSPRDSYAYLYYTYGASDDCAMNHYVHKIEMVVWCKELKRKCNKLKHKYPFVFREEAKGGVKETLKMNGTVIHSYIVHEPTYAVTKPYSLFLDEKVYRKHFNKG